MIRVKELTKVFGNISAVDRISFEVNPGEVVGFMGPNGAGKSTTMKMITCFFPPTSGVVTVCGYDVLKDPLAVRKQIGYLPESAPLYDEMTVEEFLSFMAEIRGFTGKNIKKQVEQVLEMAALSEVRRQMIETLSKGYRQRTCFAQSLISDPPVLILDEPTDGLDPNQKHEVRSLIKRMSEKRAILVSTHILEEVESVCNRAIIIAQGKIVANGTPEELFSQSRYHNAVSLKVQSGDAQGLLNQLNQLPNVASVTQLTNADTIAEFQIFPEQGQAILQDVEQFIREKKLVIEQLFVERGRLDEVFRKVTLGL